MAFVKAERKRSKLRLALVGPSGSGKTYTALKIAKGLGGKIAVIDTERGSASLYAGDVADFDVLELETHAVEKYLAGIRDAVKGGYDVLVIDSLSHAWAGKGGLLEFVDETARKQRGGSSFSAWREATPLHNRLVDAILTAPLHVVATMRSKVEHVQEKDEKGRTVIRKVGMQPIMRDGVEYEFTLVGDLTQQHEMHVTKSRCSDFADALISEPGEGVGEQLLAWLNKGVDAPPPSPSVVEDDPHAFKAAPRHVDDALTKALAMLPSDPEKRPRYIEAVRARGVLTDEEVAQLEEACRV